MKINLRLKIRTNPKLVRIISKSLENENIYINSITKNKITFINEMIFENKIIYDFSESKNLQTIATSFNDLIENLEVVENLYVKLSEK